MVGTHHGNAKESIKLIKETVTGNINLIECDHNSVMENTVAKVVIEKVTESVSLIERLKVVYPESQRRFLKVFQNIRQENCRRRRIKNNQN